MSERQWELGFGPLRLAPGEERKVDVQPKCEFKIEKIVSGDHNAGTHLSAVYVAGKEILGLGGDSIDLGRAEIVNDAPWGGPAFAIEVVISNRHKDERVVHFVIQGTAKF